MVAGCRQWQCLNWHCSVSLGTWERGCQPVPRSHLCHMIILSCHDGTTATVVSQKHQNHQRVNHCHPQEEAFNRGTNVTFALDACARVGVSRIYVALWPPLKWYLKQNENDECGFVKDCLQSGLAWLDYCTGPVQYDTTGQTGP